jgi:Fe2+ or Zn2+ uptake regulation protein
VYNEYENDFQIGDDCMTYNTKQKDLILNVIKKEKKEFTIKDIYSKLDGIGLTTIYRLVDKLVEDKVLNKSISKDNITYYQYLEKCEHENHFYLKFSLPLIYLLIDI